MNRNDRKAKADGKVKVPDTLQMVAGQPCGSFSKHQADSGALQCQPPGHNETNITRAEDHRVFSRKQVLDIHHILGCTGSIYAGRTASGDTQLPKGSLAAAHGQNNRVRGQTGRPIRFAEILDTESPVFSGEL